MKYLQFTLSLQLLIVTQAFRLPPTVAFTRRNPLSASFLDDISKMIFPPVGSAVGEDLATLLSVEPKSWEALAAEVKQTAFGQQLAKTKELWEVGAGPPHVDAKLRLFGSTSEQRVTLYRDSAGWCPYCQKVWMLFEEKKIPFKMEKINMRSYGTKPEWYLRQVPSGLLPAINLDGRLITESLVIMQTLDASFPEHPMLPDDDSPLWEKANNLLQLERELFGRWCGLVFRPSAPTSGIRAEFDRVLMKVEAELESTAGPWFLGGDDPSIVDLTYVPHLERMAASTAYWKGLQIRGNNRYRKINEWFEALEQRPSYMATKSDFYTHVRDIPPQYGDGFFSPESETSGFKSAIEGTDGSWDLPLPALTTSGLEPVLPINDKGDPWHRHEAVSRLVNNNQAVVKFACRGAGRSSGWSMMPGRAPLADPNAEPNQSMIPVVDSLLRYVAGAMLEGSSADGKQPVPTTTTNKPEAGVQAAKLCLEYLRDRVGVPRDMSYPAARQLRAHLNWVLKAL